MIEQPLISVIIPIYNAERYLEQCIQSIVNQVYQNFELILVNDGSSDSSNEICEKYASKDNRIKIIHKMNGGVSSARNRGIEKSKGEYICFVDADDQVSDKYVEHLMCGNTDIIVSGLTFISLAGATSHNIPVLFESEIKEEIGFGIPSLERMILLNGPYQKRFKKNIIDKHNIRFDETCSNGEDTLFVLTYMQYIKSLKSVPFSDYFYFRRENDSLSKKRSPSFIAYDFAKRMYILRKNMILIFSIKDRNYHREVDILFQNYLFVSIYSLYYQKMIKSERLLFLKTIYSSHYDIPLIVSRCNSMKNIISTLLLKMQNIHISDMIYQFLFKIWR